MRRLTSVHSKQRNLAPTVAIWNPDLGGVSSQRCSLIHQMMLRNLVSPKQVVNGVDGVIVCMEYSVHSTFIHRNMIIGWPEYTPILWGPCSTVLVSNIA